MKTEAWLLSAGLAMASPVAFGAVSDEAFKQLQDQISVLTQRIAELEQAKAAPAAPASAAAPSTSAAPAVASAAPAKPAASAWTEKMAIQGDFRYRYENIDAEGVEDRNRQRIRARAGITAKPQDGLELGFGLSTSQDGDPVSGNQTLGEGGSKKDIYLDLAYFNWAAMEGLNLTGGKFKNFLYRPGKHALLWDSDWNPEGFGVIYNNGMFFGSVLGTWLESDSNSTEEFSYGAQAGVAVPLGDTLKLTAGLGYFEFGTEGKGTFFGDDDDFFGNTNAGDVYVYDYEELEAFAELGFQFLGLPASFFVDYVHNSDAGEFDTGWATGLTVGAAKSKGQWEGSWAYQDLEADAVLGLLTDSDFGGGGTDNKGHVFRGAYALSNNWNLAFSYYLNEANENSEGVAEDYDRLQLDVNFKY